VLLYDCIFIYVRMSVYPFTYPSIYSYLPIHFDPPILLSIDLAFCLSMLILSVLTFFEVLFFFCLWTKKCWVSHNKWGGGIRAHFCVEHFKGNLNKHVNVKPNRSRSKADFSVGWGGDDSGLGNKEFLNFLIRLLTD
jgi:hypothetical protein